MFWEKKLTNWIESLRSESKQSALPLRLQLWNGQQFDFGQHAPQVTVKVPRASALAYLLNPSLDNLGRAYVEGKLEVDGRLSAIIDVANKLAAIGQQARPTDTAFRALAQKRCRRH